MISNARTLSNSKARRLAIDLARLTDSPTRPFGKAKLISTIGALGFVQVDSISTIARAHHHILFARAHNYTPDMLARALERDRSLFEHWSHDAAIIPTAFRPNWAVRFDRHADVVARYPHWQKRLGKNPEKTFSQIKEHIQSHGPVRTADLVDTAAPKKKGNGWWDWKPEKAALEFMWRSGSLSVTRRDGFQKVYDLSENVIPAEHAHHHPHEDCINWAGREALARLGFASAKQIAHFWHNTSLAEAKSWADQHAEEIEVEGADGSAKTFYALPETLAKRPKPAPDLARILSPFDPLIHDRDRAKFLFGFDYKLECFTPAPKRKYGYFTCPILLQDQLIGRIDLKAQRSAQTPHVAVNGLWFEPGHNTPANKQAVDEALHRFSPFALIGL